MLTPSAGMIRPRKMGAWRWLWLVGLLLTVVVVVGCDEGDETSAERSFSLFVRGPVVFPPTEIGQSVTVEVEIVNAEPYTMQIDEAYIEGTSDLFEFEDLNGTIVRGNQTLIVPVHYTATEGRPPRGRLIVEGFARPGTGRPGTRMVEFEFEPGEVDLEVSTNLLDFGAVAAGGIAEREFTVTSRSTLSVRLQVRPSAPPSGARFILPDREDATALVLEPGASRTFRVQYLPEEEFSHRARIVLVAYMGPTQEAELQEVTLLGNGGRTCLIAYHEDRLLRLRSAGLDFAAGAEGVPKQKEFTVMNCSDRQNGGTVEITGFDIGLEAALDARQPFEVITLPDLPLVLLPGDRRTLEMQWTPGPTGTVDRGWLEFLVADPETLPGRLELSGESLGSECPHIRLDCEGTDAEVGAMEGRVVTGSTIRCRASGALPWSSGRVESYQWQLRKPDGSDAGIRESRSDSAILHVDTPGSYTVELRVEEYFSGEVCGPLTYTIVGVPARGLMVDVECSPLNHDLVFEPGSELPFSCGPRLLLNGGGCWGDRRADCNRTNRNIGWGDPDRAEDNPTWTPVRTDRTDGGRLTLPRPDPVSVRVGVEVSAAPGVGDLRLSLRISVLGFEIVERTLVVEEEQAFLEVLDVAFREGEVDYLERWWVAIEEAPCP